MGTAWHYTNALPPGFAITPFNKDLLGDPKWVERILASNAARWINGHTINVDTGFNAT